MLSTNKVECFCVIQDTADESPLFFIGISCNFLFRREFEGFSHDHPFSPELNGRSHSTTTK